MKESKYEGIKFVQNVLSYLYRISKGDVSFLNEQQPAGIEEIKEQLEKIDEVLKHRKQLKLSDKDLDEIYEYKNKFEQLKTPNFNIPFKKLTDHTYNKLHMWTNVLRFASLFFNDGRVNLLTKELLSNAVNGNFLVLSTNKGELIDDSIDELTGTKMNVSDLKTIHKIYLARSEGKNINRDKVKQVNNYLSHNPLTNELSSVDPDISFSLTENGDLKCYLNESLGVKICLIVKNSDGKSDYASKYSVVYETQPLEAKKKVREARHKFVDGKKTLIPAVYENFQPDEVFDLFRNANAHANKQVYDRSKVSFSYKDAEKGQTIKYDYGWLQGFGSFFFNEGFCKLYGKNSVYKGLPGWRKDEQRKQLLVPNNEFPILLNYIPDEAFSNFNDFKEFLEKRRHLRLTINDDMLMLNVITVVDKIRDRFYFGESKDEIKFSKYYIDACMKKNKISNYTVEEVEPKYKNEMLNYWQKRLSNIDNFYNLSLEDQFEILHKIERTNKFNLEGLTTYESSKFNNEITNKMLNIINESSLAKGWEDERMEISANNVDNLKILNQEFSVLFANMLIYSSLIESGYNDTILHINAGVYDKINILDQKTIEEMDLSKFEYHKATKTGYNIVKGNSKCPVSVKKDMLRFLRNAVAHGRVEVEDIHKHYENPDDIRLVFPMYGSTNKNEKVDKVITNVGAIMETFSSANFSSPTHTEIKGNSFRRS